MEKIKIGFLPLYIKLYDDAKNGAARRPRLEGFAKRLIGEFTDRGFDVVTTPDLCRIRPEFEAAIASFEKAGCKAIVTWHAAYHPSLESIESLAGTKLPLNDPDTTETYAFDPTQEPGEISYCHGIHGVMDMCSMLHRYGKPFAIAAGHIEHSDVIERTIGFLRAAVAATSLEGTRTGTIGGSFDGMGDFLVSDEDMLKRFGVTVVYPKKGELARYAKAVTDEQIKAEIEADNAAYKPITEITDECHERTARNCLAVRKWIEKQNLSAFTANFREIGNGTGLNIMPFMEACKAMSRGIGYAGEGDVLTASLVGALMQGYKDATTFVEIFCPDWKGNTVFLSHMGEYNPAVTTGEESIAEMNFVYGGAKNPLVTYGCYKGGDAIFVNLFQTKAEGFKLFISPVEMLQINPDTDRFKNKVRGWFKPCKPLPEFLEAISFAGATHHSCLVYGARVAEIEYFAKLLGLPYTVCE
jgi:L-arabinose isomerase